MAMMAKQLDQQTLLGFVKSDLEANPEKVDAAKAEFITLLKSQVKVSVTNLVHLLSYRYVVCRSLERSGRQTRMSS